jgi:hypothetical protein
VVPSKLSGEDLTRLLTEDTSDRLVEIVFNNLQKMYIFPSTDVFRLSKIYPGSSEFYEYVVYNHNKAELTKLQ